MADGDAAAIVGTLWWQHYSVPFFEQGENQMADYSVQIAEIEAILRAGSTQVVVDGNSITYSFPALRQELRRLRKENTASDAAEARPAVLRMKLKGV